MSNRDLASALRSCSLHVLLILVSRALARSGFGDVQIMGRRRVRQRTRKLGFELSCNARMGSVPLSVLVKVSRDSARVRMLDELAGVVIREGADVGVLVVTGPASAEVRNRLKAYGSVHLVLLDGPELGGLLAGHGIGVRPKGGVDYAFLAELEAGSARLLRAISREGGHVS